MARRNLKETTVSVGDALLRHLRSCVQPPGKKSLFLRDLSDRRLLEVYERLCMGQSLAQIRRLITEKWKLHRGMNPKSLENSLGTFKKRAVPPLKAKPAGLRTQEDKRRFEEQRHADRSRAKYHVEKLDTLARMRWLIDHQTDRVVRWKAIEDEMQKPQDGARQDVRCLGELLRDALRLEIDLGVRDRAPNEIVLTHKAKFDSMIQGLPNDGRDLLAAADRLLEAAEEKMLTLEVAPDGTYAICERTEADKIRDLALGDCGGISIKTGTRGEVEDSRFDDPGLFDLNMPDDGD
jgi:hypothetical protein